MSREFKSSYFCIIFHLRFATGLASNCFAVSNKKTNRLEKMFTIQITESAAEALKVAQQKTGLSQAEIIERAAKSLAQQEESAQTRTNWLSNSECQNLAVEFGRFWKTDTAVYSFIRKAKAKGLEIKKLGPLVNRLDFEAALKALPSKHERRDFNK